MDSPLHQTGNYASFRTHFFVIQHDVFGTVSLGTWDLDWNIK